MPVALDEHELYRTGARPARHHLAEAYRSSVSVTPSSRDWATTASQLLSEHFERDLTGRGGELVSEVFEILVCEPDVERFAIRAHVIGLRGFGDREHALLSEDLRDCDLGGCGASACGQIERWFLSSASARGVSAYSTAWSPNAQRTIRGSAGLANRHWRVRTRRWTDLDNSRQSK